MTQRQPRDTTDPGQRPPPEPGTEDGDTQEAPIGDPPPARELPEKFPGRREHQTGNPGGKA